MTTSNIKATLSCDIHKVWEIITAVKNYTWRSDLSKTEVISSRQFIEYTKEGYPTTLQSLLQSHISVGNLIWKTAT